MVNGSRQSSERARSHRPSSAHTAVVATLLTLGSGAHAQDQHSVGWANELRGFIVTEVVLTRDDGRTYTAGSRCAVAPVVGPWDRVDLLYAGTASAAGSERPLVVSVRCRLDNDHQESASEASADGAVAATAALAARWALRQTRLCASGFAVFDSSPPIVLTVPEVCADDDLPMADHPSPG